MRLTTETPQALEAGVAPYSMQQGYDRLVKEKQDMMKSLSGFGAPGQQQSQGSQNTVLTPQQMQMNEAQRRAVMEQNNRPITEQDRAAASAIDAANQAKRLQEYQMDLESQKQLAAPTGGGFLDNFLDSLRKFKSK